MNHGSGDGVCVVSPNLVDYCAVNGTTNWQSSIPCLPTCQFFSGSAPVITENNGSDNIAIFTVTGGYLFFYWSDSTGTFHKETVASGVT
jgi:hypothetical protein